MSPKKPFPTFKWRWACLQPTPGLLDSDVFLGVLRVLARHEGDKPGCSAVIDELKRVKKDTNTSVDLVRTPKRNLIRNSGQYWKGTGLLEPRPGVIELTNFGRGVADGTITQSEFAATMIDQFTLPNKRTFSKADMSSWKKARLEIKPLKLILEVISEISTQIALSSEHYLTPEELIKVVIPLSGATAAAKTIASYVLKYRASPSIINGWPNCSPRSNDARYAKEFLLFLSNFSVLSLSKLGSHEVAMDDRFYLEQPLDITNLSVQSGNLNIFSNEKEVLDAVRHSSLPSIIERNVVKTTIRTKRTGQDKFRKRVIRAYETTCFLTGERIPNILEAAHIIPVDKNGADDVCNGICLRVDVHRLFDTKHIRIAPDGSVGFSDVVRNSKSYLLLPKKVVIPHFVSPVNLRWRHLYC